MRKPVVAASSINECLMYTVNCLCESFSHLKDLQNNYGKLCKCIYYTLYVVVNIIGNLNHF